MLLVPAALLGACALASPAGCSYGVDSYTLQPSSPKDNPECIALLDSGVSIDAAAMGVEAGLVDPSLLGCFGDVEDGSVQDGAGAGGSGGAGGAATGGTSAAGSSAAGSSAAGTSPAGGAGP